VAQPELDPATQAKGLKFTAGTLIVGGLLIGIVVPLLFLNLRIEAYMTPWGFDVYWVVCLAMMVFDFVLAWIIWRRADAIDRQLQGLPPRP